MISSSLKAKNVSRPKTSSQLKVIKTSGHRTLMCLTPSGDDFRITTNIQAKEFPAVNNSKKSENKKKIKLNSNILKTNITDEDKDLKISNEKFDLIDKDLKLVNEKLDKNEQYDFLTEKENENKYFSNVMKFKKLNELLSPQSIQVNFNSSSNNLLTPNIGKKASGKNIIRNEDAIFKTNFTKKENETIKKLMERIEYLEERLKTKEKKISELEKKINSKSESARLDKLSYLIGVLEEKINLEIKNLKILTNENNNKVTKKWFSRNDISNKSNEKNESSKFNEFKSNKSLILINSKDIASPSQGVSIKEFNFLSGSDNLFSPNNIDSNDKYSSLKYHKILESHGNDISNEKIEIFGSTKAIQQMNKISNVKSAKYNLESNEEIFVKEAEYVFCKNYSEKKNQSNKILIEENKISLKNNEEKSKKDNLMMSQSKSLDNRFINNKVLNDSMIFNNNFNSQNIINLLENTIIILYDLKEKILDSKKYTSYVKEKEKQIYQLKQELEIFKQKEKHEKKIYDNLKSKISDLEFENTKLAKYSKSDQILKMMENNSDNYFAKQNVELKRRLEIACLLLVKKKEKVGRLNEKCEALTKEIKGILNSKEYFESEEKKMTEVLHKKLVYEKVSKGEEKIIEFLENDNFKTNSKNSSNKQTEDNFTSYNYRSNKLNYEMSDDLKYRVDRLKEDYKELMKDI